MGDIWKLLEITRKKRKVAKELTLYLLDTQFVRKKNSKLIMKNTGLVLMNLKMKNLMKILLFGTITFYIPFVMLIMHYRQKFVN